jgi:hypothetical protein
VFTFFEEDAFLSLWTLIGWDAGGLLWTNPTTDPSNPARKFWVLGWLEPLQHPTQMTHWSTQNQAAPCIGEEEDTRAGAQGTST